MVFGIGLSALGFVQLVVVGVTGAAVVVVIAGRAFVTQAVHFSGGGFRFTAKLLDVDVDSGQLVYSAAVEPTASGDGPSVMVAPGSAC